MSHINSISSQELSNYLSRRPGETKLGEVIELFGKDWMNDMANSPCKFVVFGIPEDIGPRANLGNDGSHKSWPAFLKKFLNMQSNRFYTGDDLAILGEVRCLDLMNDSKDLNPGNENDLKILRNLVSKLDDRVAHTCRAICEAGKIPIAIGGGHNNSYGLIKGASMAANKSIDCINLDPHADYRALEGRHSGNGFSYAKTEGFLDQYFVMGLHESYNSEHILERVPNKFDYTSFEAIVNGEISFDEALQRALNRFQTRKPCGIELDLDSIENIPTSAITPCGVNTFQARRYVIECGRQLTPAYLHLAEGAPANEPQSQTVGKLLAYLVVDFLKSCSTQNL